MNITRITEEDFKSFWPVFKATVEARETYAFDPDIRYEDAYHLWCLSPTASFIARENGGIVGSYYIKPNAAGPGSHICNCGYIVSPEARGRGIARKLCVHSQEAALKLGFSAMQFNAVVSTNKAAIHLWKSLGFSTIGCIPEGYQHAEKGYVDAFIMYKKLGT